MHNFLKTQHLVDHHGAFCAWRGRQQAITARGASDFQYKQQLYHIQKDGHHGTKSWCCYSTDTGQSRWSGALSLVVAALIAQCGATWADTLLSGPARVIDGDTLEIAGERVRLLGIDAPEKAQVCQNIYGQEYNCGEAIKETLKNKLGSTSISCQAQQHDMYGRNISKCEVPGMGDLGSWLVSNGYAVAYRQYSKDYIALEESAHTAHRGIWAGSFQIPAEWRRQHKRSNLPVQKLDAPSLSREQRQILASIKRKIEQPDETRLDTEHPADCTIKGNISSNGKIYHVPGNKSYNSVRIDRSAGEQWFCSRDEAERAGWRPAKS